MIAIVDCGMGNIHSVNKALKLYGAKTVVTNKPEGIEPAEKIVLPGVGAFADAMLALERQNLIPALNEHIRNRKTFLGICLGMQLLFETSEEANKSAGLKVFKGRVRGFKASRGLKVPHMGWNQIKKRKVDCPLLKGISDNAYLYFCHSYYPEPSDNAVIAATCSYGIDFPAVAWQDNVYGVQFHPEKSQAAGLAMLKNFVQLC